MDIFREYYILSFYARIENGIVTAVIVADSEVIKTYDGEWVETFPDAKPDTGHNYAGIGYSYDPNGKGAFIPPKPFDSWTLDVAVMDWKAPKAVSADPRIADKQMWDEKKQDWVMPSDIAVEADVIPE